MSLLYKIADNIDEINHKPRLEKRQPEAYARVGRFIYTKPEVVMVFLAYALGGAFLFWLGYMAVMSGGI